MSYRVYFHEQKLKLFPKNRTSTIRISLSHQRCLLSSIMNVTRKRSLSRANRCYSCRSQVSLFYSAFHQLSATDINGNAISFSSLTGKVTLITNVASRCGFTDSHCNLLRMPSVSEKGNPGFLQTRRYEKSTASTKTKALRFLLFHATNLVVKSLGRMQKSRQAMHN